MREPLAYLSQPEVRRNLVSLAKYLAFVAGAVVFYALVFQALMAREGQDHSLLDGVYWTLVTMSTLGYGDIVFDSDLGRAFSIVVILSGIVMLLIVLPFAFIRHFYVPWIESQINQSAPREVPRWTSGHVVVCCFDPVARELVARLKLMKIPYYLLEPEPAAAAALHGSEIPVVMGDPESKQAFEAVRVSSARGVFVNAGDPINTNIALTIREIDAEVPIIATADDEDSIDILELAGASHVLPLKRQLGQHLANRVNAGHAEAHEVGRFRDLVLAEFPVHNMPYVGKTIRETKLRRAIGVNIVGVWELGKFEAAHPDRRLTSSSVPVVLGTQAQIEALNELLLIYDTNYSPALVIGGGKVGSAAVRALKKRDVAVHLVERDADLARRAAGMPDRIFVGDAADRTVLLEAGLAEAPAVILSTNDDSTNIYLAVYCRRLNPELRIISRITHDRNLEAIHRAGADFALSYAALGAEAAFAVVQQRELMLLGAGFELFNVPVPGPIAGKTLAESGIGALTGLNVLAIRDGQTTTANPRATSPLPASAELLMLGTPDQRSEFMRRFR
jgi:voltage-gated potassium channel